MWFNFVFAVRVVLVQDLLLLMCCVFVSGFLGDSGWCCIAMIACRDIRCMCVMWYWGWREICLCPTALRGRLVQYVFGLGMYLGWALFGVVILWV